MLFVPLPLFATFALCLVLIRLCVTRDMTRTAHRLFALVVALYAVQSLLLCLRWGYQIEAVAPLIAMLAPCLPVFAYLAYLSLADTLSRRNLWPLAVIAVNWLVLVFQPMMVDPPILLTYLGFGVLLLRLAWRGSDALPLSRISDATGALRAIRLTGAALVASSVTDVYLIYDFVQNGGRHIGLIVTFVQTAFVLVIGLSAALGQTAAADTGQEQAPPPTPPASDEDGEIIARLTALFEQEGLHRNEELSLRKLSRRLGLPDRRVSNAVNRICGMNLSQFVNDFRVNEARRLLAETDKSVLEVSLDAGFATKSNFNREFARVTGQTPSGWRKQAKAAS
ncbi:helix-turn-helix domain-containing protein [Sulfitobacter geojensis]|uniref:helix-turn-helix domain-containing protein n=1 Tax=Sulfitobacter geojensis TaxID=1342299 RepID=UPI00046ADCB2|nr:AraC family transcriptional regulator [Sulfitobacter geojensis]KHA50663.1 Transcriptional regulator, AraC family [Sulfitobacter geojensis]NYI26955.1 AraC-like DNA-binding protein [Sulfitobacter geojensis]